MKERTFIGILCEQRTANSPLGESQKTACLFSLDGNSPPRWFWVPLLKCILGRNIHSNVSTETFLGEGPPNGTVNRKSRMSAISEHSDLSSRILKLFFSIRFGFQFRDSERSARPHPRPVFDLGGHWEQTVWYWLALLVSPIVPKFFFWFTSFLLFFFSEMLLLEQLRLQRTIENGHTI